MVPSCLLCPERLSSGPPKRMAESSCVVLEHGRCAGCRGPWGLCGPAGNAEEPGRGLSSAARAAPTASAPPLPPDLRFLPFPLLSPPLVHGLVFLSALTSFSPAITSTFLLYVRSPPPLGSSVILNLLLVVLSWHPSLSGPLCPWLELSLSSCSLSSLGLLSESHLSVCLYLSVSLYISGSPPYRPSPALSRCLPGSLGRLPGSGGPWENEKGGERRLRETEICGTNAAEQLSGPRVLGFLPRPSGSSPPGSSPPLQLVSPQATLPGPLPCPGPPVAPSGLCRHLVSLFLFPASPPLPLRPSLRPTPTPCPVLPQH